MVLHRQCGGGEHIAGDGDRTWEKQDFLQDRSLNRDAIRARRTRLSNTFFAVAEVAFVAAPNHFQHMSRSEIARLTHVVDCAG
jgi:hypothetical protein